MTFKTIALVALAALASSASAQAVIEVSIPPFYDVDGPSVNVGPFSEALAAANQSSILDVAAQMRESEDSLPATAMYVVAARLYDLGHRDESVEWFYDAQFRSRLFGSIVDPDEVGVIGSPAFEERAAGGAFAQLVGPYINGYAGCDKDVWLGAIRRVAARNESVADLREAYPSVVFLPEEEWADANARIGSGLTDMADQVESRWEEFQTMRAENGLDEQFCQSTG